MREGYQLGLREFGENYVQEFETKRVELAGCSGARFHLIGHLQSNKARKAAEIFDVIQTVDSAKLAQRLDETENARLDVMIEVKLSERIGQGRRGTRASCRRWWRRFAHARIFGCSV